MELSYGEITIDSSTLPEVSVKALLQRGLAHYLGNEQASKVAGKFPAPTNGEAPASDEAKAQFKAECVAAAVKALAEGTVGTRVGGPRGTAEDTIVRQLAEKEVRDILKHNKLTMPTGDKVVEFANGTKLTRQELIDRRIANHGERLRQEAKKEMARREREAAKAGSVDALL
jgi:hypothetical protein